MRQSTPSSKRKSATGSPESLVQTLQMLFDLLEEYAPSWYTQEHHDRVLDELASVRKRSSPSPIRRAPKQQKAA